MPSARRYSRPPTPPVSATEVNPVQVTVPPLLPQKSIEDPVAGRSAALLGYCEARDRAGRLRDRRSRAVGEARPAARHRPSRGRKSRGGRSPGDRRGRLRRPGGSRERTRRHDAGHRRAARPQGHDRDRPALRARGRLSPRVGLARRRLDLVPDRQMAADAQVSRPPGLTGRAARAGVAGRRRENELTRSRRAPRAARHDGGGSARSRHRRVERRARTHGHLHRVRRDDRPAARVRDRRLPRHLHIRQHHDADALRVPAAAPRRLRELQLRRPRDSRPAQLDAGDRHRRRAVLADGEQHRVADRDGAAERAGGRALDDGDGHGQRPSSRSR